MHITATDCKGKVNGTIETEEKNWEGTPPRHTHPILRGELPTIGSFRGKYDRKANSQHQHNNKRAENHR